MDIELDNIIFSLQKAGGVSAVWYENIKRLVDNKEFNLRFLEYDNAKENFFRKQLSIDNESVKIQNSKLLFLIEGGVGFLKENLLPIITLL